MENPLTLDPEVYSLSPQAHHIPTEVCENIIDMLYSHITVQDTLKDIATLHSCALVCRDWRVRSQRMLFYKIQLFNSPSFYKLAAIFDAGQHLRDYVHQVELTGYCLQTTTSIFALFPAVFTRKLPKLERIHVVHLGCSDPWHPQTSDSPKFKSLPYIPLHPRFPIFLSSFTAVSALYLEYTIFHSFTEVARMLHGLPSLEVLTCVSISWITTGGSYFGADFMKQPDWTAGRYVPPPFAPKLGKLQLANMARYGVERLIRTRGPHLKWLEMTIPLSSGIEEGVGDGGVDLSSCTGLQTLQLALTPQFSTDEHATLIAGLLASWKPQNSESILVLRLFYQMGITRSGFADTLRGLGTILEASLRALQQPSPTGEPKKLPIVQYGLHFNIYDWEERKDWWLNHLYSCFPSWARQQRLRMVFCTPTNEVFEWATEEKPSPSDVVPSTELEGAKPSSPCKLKDARSEPGSQPI